MSGTSLDGVDVALVEIRGERDVTLRGFRTRPYTAEERDRILDAIANGTARELAQLHRNLGEWFAEAAESLLGASGASPADLSFIASHGQTVWHDGGRASLQLGCPATIAERLGVRVVSDFRARDVAAGGQGAPLVPMADVMLFGAEHHPRVLLNIGGMANVTWVPRGGALEGVLAFDTGPGVAVIDAVVRALIPGLAFDEGGRHAAAGSPAPEIVDELLDAAFFAAPPPKSTGREVFGATYAAQLVAAVRRRRPDASADDCIATAVLLTARSIAGQVRRWLPDFHTGDLVASGGGTRNPAVIASLSRELGGVPVGRFDDVFFDGDAKEAVAFAYLGWRTLHGLAGNVPGATGAVVGRVLGSVTPG
jgi:anhydro-N-acetylmuramic acid kinase